MMHECVFRPRAAFDGHVLFFIRKKDELDDVERLYPAKHYVMIDDKLRILESDEKGDEQ
jgi:hypothetical protein